MPLKIKLLLISVLFVSFASAQSLGIKGSVIDLNDSTRLTGATITLSLAIDTVFKHTTITSSTGAFEFRNVPKGQYRLTISFIGYDQLQKTVILNNKDINLGVIPVPKKASLLDEVFVKGQVPPVKQKNDTLEYNASSFKVNPDANADDMIKKMPGITMDQNGVKAGGEDIKKVTVDGRDFFGDDATAALKNLPAEIIDKIQVFDRLSDQARFTGFDDGTTTKSINIVTKAGMKNGQFGRLYAGFGTGERYSAGGNVSFFNNNRRISLVGQSNNINQQNFATEDLLGVTSSSNRGGGRSMGGSRGGNGGAQRQNSFNGGGSGNFLVGQQGGINKTNAFGINYSDKWGQKTDVTGSYFFNNTNNASNELTNRETFLSGDTSQLYDENSISNSKNYNHRVNLRIEYKIDSANTILFTPNISFQNNKSISTIQAANSIKGATGIISSSLNNTIVSSNGYNINNGVLYRHAFKKRGRTISLNLNTGFNDRDGETHLTAANKYDSGDKVDTLLQYKDQSTDGYNISTNIAYTEPIGKQGQLQVNYNPSWKKSNADQITYLLDSSTGKYSIPDSTLSNKYNNLYAIQNAGVSYRLGGKDNSFSVGFAFQNASLTGERIFPMSTDVNRNFNNILPNLMFRKKLSERSRINLNYRASTNAPSIDQLQDVINNSNPLFLKTGNPELDQEYSHRITTRYTYTNSTKGQSFFANIFLQQTDDYIANATYVASQDSVLSNSVTLYRGSQLIKPINLDGFRSLRSFFTFSTPLKFIKSNINLNTGYSYSESPGLINNVENKSKTKNYSFGAVLASNVSEYIDFNLSYTANFNKVRNSIQPDLNNDYFTQVAGIEINLLSKNGWFIQNNVNNQSYSGLTDGFNQSFWLWNISAGKKFLKNQNADLRLTVFDLLKQNRSISRTTTETYIEDVQTRVLQQYFMLTFSYRLRNFGGKTGFTQGR